MPTPVVQTVGDRTYTTVHPDDFPNALNAHPYAAKGEGIQTRRPIFERLPASGTGFEYGCVTSKGEAKIYAGQNASGNELTDYRSWILLGKKDQVWIVKKDQNVIRDNTYYYYEWDELFPQLRTTEVERENEDGTTETISLYEDIFQFGMVQSIAKARNPGGTNILQAGSYHIFYNDGMGREDSNKSF